MKIAIAFAACAAAACTLASSVPARAGMPVAAPVMRRVDGTVLLRQNEPTAQLIGTELFVPAGLDRETPAQDGLAALVAECILQTPVGLVPGEPLALSDAIAAQGGSLSYAVDGQNVRFYLEGLAQTYSGALLPAFRRALASPDFSATTRNIARLRIERHIERAGKSALTVGLAMLDRVFYENSDAGLPQYGTLAMQVRFTGDDARAFYTAHYRRDGTIVSAIGDLGALAPGDLASLARALPVGRSRAADVRLRRLSATSRQLVARRDVALPWLVAQYRVPDIDSPDFGAMLVLAAFLDRTFFEVAEIPSVSMPEPAQRDAGAVYNFDTRPASLVLYVGGGLGDPSRTFTTALTVLNALQRAPLQSGIVDLKAGALGFFVRRANTLEERARLAGIFALRSSSADYFGRVASAISATTASDLQRAAKRYFGSPTIALILPRAAPAPAQ